MDIDELDLPDALRPYQWEGVSFLAKSEGALLADEMGMGKTVQAAVALRIQLAMENVDRALIVTPTSLSLNWMRELATWAPGLTVRLVEGTAADRRATYALPIPVLITTYEQLRIDRPQMPADLWFDIVVLDEAQRDQECEFHERARLSVVATHKFLGIDWYARRELTRRPRIDLRLCPSRSHTGRNAKTSDT
jgi:SNF2 family DNA or RNA helicase